MLKVTNLFQPWSDGGGGRKVGGQEACSSPLTFHLTQSFQEVEMIFLCLHIQSLSSTKYINGKKIKQYTPFTSQLLLGGGGQAGDSLHLWTLHSTQEPHRNSNYKMQKPREDFFHLNCQQGLRNSAGARIPGWCSSAKGETFKTRKWCVGQRLYEESHLKSKAVQELPRWPVSRSVSPDQHADSKLLLVQYPRLCNALQVLLRIERN